MIKKMSLAIFAAFLLIPYYGCSSNNQNDNSSPSSTASSSSSSSALADKSFIDTAAEGGMAEVELGRLAAEKAASSDVKRFGKRMVTDHTKANNDLKQSLGSQSSTLPTSLSSKDQALKDRLSSLSGKDFDKAYMQAMVDDHMEDVSDFQREANSGQNTTAKDWATRTLPTLQEHLQMARDINDKVKDEK